MAVPPSVLLLLLLAAVECQANVDIVPAGSIWKYYDAGGDVASTFSGVAFDDSAWQSGKGACSIGQVAVPSTQCVVGLMSATCTCLLISRSTRIRRW